MHIDQTHFNGTMYYIKLKLHIVYNTYKIYAYSIQFTYNVNIISYIYVYLYISSSFAIAPISFEYLLRVESKVFSFPLFLSHFYVNWPAEGF